VWSIKTKNPDRLLPLHKEEKVVCPGAYAKNPYSKEYDFYSLHLKTTSPHSPVIYGNQVETHGPYPHYYTREKLFAINNSILTTISNPCQLIIEHLK
jgi:hypothetical protein